MTEAWCQQLPPPPWTLGQLTVIINFLTVLPLHGNLLSSAQWHISRGRRTWWRYQPLTLSFFTRSHFSPLRPMASPNFLSLPCQWNSASQNKPFKPYPDFLYYLFFLTELGFEFRDLYLPGRCSTLYHLNHASSPFCFSWFLDRVFCFCPGWPWTWILLPMAPA
jgi:hypothetical protein